MTSTGGEAFIMQRNTEINTMTIAIFQKRYLTPPRFNNNENIYQAKMLQVLGSDDFLKKYNVFPWSVLSETMFP